MNLSVFWHPPTAADKITKLQDFDDFPKCFADRLAVWRSAGRMSSFVWTVLTVSLGDGAAMTCWTAWTTVMRKTAARVCMCVISHVLECDFNYSLLVDLWSLKSKKWFFYTRSNSHTADCIIEQMSHANISWAFYIKETNQQNNVWQVILEQKEAEEGILNTIRMRNLRWDERQK